MGKDTILCNGIYYSLVSRKKLTILGCKVNFSSSTVVGDNINIIKTTFELNLNFYQAFKLQGYTKIWKRREAVNLKCFTLNTCKLVIQKKHVNN